MKNPCSDISVTNVGDMISRQAAIDGLYEMASDIDHLCTVGDYVKFLESLPSAEPQREKGQWEVCNILDYAQRPTGRKILRCPFCGYLTDEFRSRVDYYLKLTHFCPNCGAEMIGPDIYE